MVKHLTHFEDHYEGCNAAYHEEETHCFSLRTKNAQHPSFTKAASRSTSKIAIPFELKEATFISVNTYNVEVVTSHYWSSGCNSTKDVNTSTSYELSGLPKWQ